MMRRGVTGLLLMAAVLAAGPAQAGWVLWDDFNTGVVLDLSRWLHADHGTDGGFALEEFLFIDALLFPTSNPQLVIVRRVRGDIFASDRLRLLPLVPKARAIDALVTPVACIGSAAGGYSAGLEWENTAYYAQLQLSVPCPDPQGANARIFWWVYQNNPDGTRTKLAEGTFGPKPVLGQPHTLRLGRSGNVFTFVLVTAAGTSQQSHTVAPDGSDGTGQVAITTRAAGPEPGVIFWVAVDDVGLDLP